MIGVPLGKNLATGAAVCCDPISWFQRAQLISNPSMFVLGKPGLGKSSLTRRMATGLAGYGTIPLVLGDLKPDYVDLIEALDGRSSRSAAAAATSTSSTPARRPTPRTGSGHARPSCRNGRRSSERRRRLRAGAPAKARRS